MKPRPLAGALVPVVLLSSPRSSPCRRRWPRTGPAGAGPMVTARPGEGSGVDLVEGRRKRDLEGPADQRRRHRARDAGRIRRPRLHQRPRRIRRAAAGARRLLGRGHGPQALGAALPGLQHDRSVQPGGLGEPGRGSRDGIRLRPERRRAPVASTAMARPSGTGAWARSSAAARASVAARSYRSSTRTALIIGLVGAGWGDLAGPRQRYVAFDKRTGARALGLHAVGRARSRTPTTTRARPSATIEGRRLMIGGAPTAGSTPSTRGRASRCGSSTSASAASTARPSSRATSSSPPTARRTSTRRASWAAWSRSTARQG